MSRGACIPPDGYDPERTQLLKALITRGVTGRVGGACMAQCGIYKNPPYFEGAQSTRPALAEGVSDSDKVISF